MTLHKKVIVGLMVGVAAMVTWLVGRADAIDSDGDGRGQTAAWVTPPTGLPRLAAQATTTNPIDRMVEIELQDSAAVMLSCFGTSCNPALAQGVMGVGDALEAYPSGATFTIVARYYDAVGTLVDTESIPFTKP